MTDVLLYNTTDAPVLIDQVGHVLGGREHGIGDLDDAVCAAAVESGQLLVTEEDVPAAEQAAVVEPVVVEHPPAPVPTVPKPKAQAEIKEK